MHDQMLDIDPIVRRSLEEGAVIALPGEVVSRGVGNLEYLDTSFDNNPFGATEAFRNSDLIKRKDKAQTFRWHLNAVKEGGGERIFGIAPKAQTPEGFHQLDVEDVLHRSLNGPGRVSGIEKLVLLMVHPEKPEGPLKGVNLSQARWVVINSGRGKAA